jgi:pseudaminic acid cytidylyltransferase
MIQQHRVIAIIPARGGSKRIPRKNIKLFYGVPLIENTINILRDTEIFDEIIVSTDDLEIKSIAESAGASVPFIRAKEISLDTTPTAPVIIDVFHRLKFDPNSTIACTVYPASVLISPDTYIESFTRFMNSDVDVLHAALRFSYPVERALKLDTSGLASMVWPENRMVRSQDLSEFYYDAGQFYWARANYWVAQLDEPVAAKLKVALHLLKPWEAVDIDNLDDWQFAERLYRLSRT